MKEKEYKKVIQNAFDEASAGYDRSAMRFFDKSAEYLVKHLSIQGHEQILDVATGTGKIALLLAKRLNHGHVTGVDLSEGMLALAKEKARRENLKNVLFRCADVDSMGWPKDYFDGLCCGFGVHFWSDMEKSLSRLVGMVKPGGFVAMTSFAKGSFEPQSNFCLARFKDYGVKLPDTYTWERLDSARKAEELLEKIGLNNIQSYQTRVGYYLESANEWWDLVLYSGFRAFLNQLSKEQITQYKGKHLKEIQNTADKKGIYLNIEVIFTVADR